MKADGADGVDEGFQEARIRFNYFSIFFTFSYMIGLTLKTQDYIEGVVTGMLLEERQGLVAGHLM